MDGLHQLRRARVFQDIAQRPGFDGRKDLVVGGKAGQHQHPGGTRHAGLPGRDLARRLDAVHPGHDQVHQDHVGAQRLCLGDRLQAVARFPYHLDVGLRAQQGADALAQNGVVIGNENTNG